jgi:2-oxo-4-hydroxy-4-carboxy-5-ureidoimidazoline decarboxylase
MDRAQFTTTLGEVFEHSPWVPERAYAARPFADIGQLHAVMVAEVNFASHAEQLALLQAHPELAGREARTGELTAASTAEQSGAGLNALSKDEMARVSRLNADYQQKFGFPFIIAVRKHTKQSILAEFERRLANDADTELATCLEQVFIIARLRLDVMLAQG